jgi:hypothetical protein
LRAKRCVEIGDTDDNAVGTRGSSLFNDTGHVADVESLRFAALYRYSQFDFGNSKSCLNCISPAVAVGRLAKKYTTLAFGRRSCRHHQWSYNLRWSQRKVVQK